MITMNRIITAHLDQELGEKIFNEVGNVDYIYTVIQECVDECAEEQLVYISKS